MTDSRPDSTVEHRPTSEIRVQLDALTRERSWLHASIELTRLLLAGSEEADALVLVARSAREVSASALVAIGLLTDPDTLTIRAAVGDGAAALASMTSPLRDAVSAPVVRSGRPMLLPAVRPAGRFSARLFQAGAPSGPAMVVPLLVEGWTRGAMAFTRSAGSPAFTEVDLELGAAFARQVTVALELREYDAVHLRLEALADRERIARDLHDRVIQRVFGAGLTLRAGSAGLDNVAVDEVFKDLEDIIEEIREVIGELSDGAPAPGQR